MFNFPAKLTQKTQNYFHMHTRRSKVSKK